MGLLVTVGNLSDFLKAYGPFFCKKGMIIITATSKNDFED